MAEDLLRYAYTTIKDGFELDDFPDLEYFDHLDHSEASKRMLEEAAQEVAKKLLARAATLASQRLLDELLPRLEDLRLPDHHGQAELLVSDVHFKTSDAIISRVHRPESFVSIDENIISWTLTNIGLSGTGNWAYDFIAAQDNGGFDLSIGGMSGAVSIALERDDRGRIDMRLKKCDVTFGETDVQFTGGVGCFCLMLVFELVVKPELSRIVPDLLKRGVKEIVENTVPQLRYFEEYWPLALGVVDISSNLLQSAIH